MKGSCKKCYYGGRYIPGEKLASCKSARISGPIILKNDPEHRAKQQYVHREYWEQEVECGCYIPLLTESSGDFELEEEISFRTILTCPNCSEEIDVRNLFEETIHLIECYNCNQRIAVKGKGV